MRDEQSKSLLDSLELTSTMNLADACANGSSIRWSTYRPIKTLGTCWQERNTCRTGDKQQTHPSSLYFQLSLTPLGKVDSQPEHPQVSLDTVVLVLGRGLNGRLTISKHDPIVLTSLGELHSNHAKDMVVAVKQDGQSYICGLNVESCLMNEGCTCPPGGWVIAGAEDAPGAHRR